MKKGTKRGTRHAPAPGTATHKVWEAVAAHGPLSRQRVSEMTGVRPAIVSTVAQDLINRGLLDRDDKTQELKLP